MKISEQIAVLQDLLDEHGDVEAMIDCGGELYQTLSVDLGEATDSLAFGYRYVVRYKGE